MSHRQVQKQKRVKQYQNDPIHYYHYLYKQGLSNSVYCYIISKKYISQWFAAQQQRKPISHKMNYDLYTPNDLHLRTNLKLNHDYQYVNEELFYYIKKKRLGGIYIRQKLTNIMNGNGKNKFRQHIQYLYLILSQNDIKKIKQNKLNLTQQYQRQIIIPLSFCHKYLIESIKHSEQYIRNKDMKLWKVKLSINGLKNIFMKHFRQNKKWTDPITDHIGQEITEFNYTQTLVKPYFRQNFFILVQIKEKYDKWFIQIINQSALTTSTYDAVKTQNKMFSSYFSMQQSQNFDKKISSVNKKPKFFSSITTYSNQQQYPFKKLVGLQNLGNTCFMNSALQCLVHTLPFSQYFLKKMHTSQIHYTNNYGSKGQMPIKFANLLEDIAISHSTVSPHQLKRTFGSNYQQYRGYGQHDSSQFYSLLVDCLHEDLCRIKHKEYVQQVEIDGKTQKQLAFENWQALTRRNQSIVTDLMTGLLRTKLKCRVCDEQCISFDGFRTVHLPIPRNNEQVIKFVFYYYPYNLKQRKCKYEVISDSYCPDRLFEKAVECCSQKSRDNFLFYILSQNDDVQNIQNLNEVSLGRKIKNGCKCYLVEKSLQEQQIKDPITVIIQFFQSSYYHNKSLIIKRPFLFPKSQFSGKYLAKTILQYLSKIQSPIIYSKNLDYQETQWINGPTYPFDLIFVSGTKSYKKYYDKTQILFSSQKVINDDSTLMNMIGSLTEQQFQIHVKFKQNQADKFRFDPANSYVDKTYQQNGRRKRQAIVNKNYVQLSACFQQFTKPQNLNGDNQCYCRKCDDLRPVSKKLQIYKVPEIMVFIIKRFKCESYLKSKDYTEVIFPKQLSMGEITVDPQPMFQFHQKLKKSQHYKKPPYQMISEKSSLNYELYGVINHFGGLQHGHYTAHCKKQKKWYQFNDSFVREVSEKEVNGRDAYVLFYKREKGISLR